MVWCGHCQEEVETVRDYDKGYTCCTMCGRVVEHDIYTNEPTYYKDSSGQSRLNGSIMSSMEGAYTLSRERTIRKGEDEIRAITISLQMGGGETTVGEATRLYKIAVGKDFTKGRRTSHVAAACLYINCRAKKTPYLLIDFSDHLMISVYVLGAVFLQLCKLLSLSEHPIVQNLIDPSLFIHRFTERLLGRRHELVTSTALKIVASMKRDWMQTGRKPSGLCGAALYISVLSHGINYSKSDIVTVVHICEATLTKRLIEFENTESGGLTIEEFLRRADDLKGESVPSQLPRSGEVLCKHKDEGEPHFAHGLCKACYNELVEISGGLEGSTEPPAFQRAVRQRMDIAKAQEKLKESRVDDLEIGGPEIGSSSAKCESPASKEHQAVDTAASNEARELNNSVENDPESLSDIDDVEVNGYLHNDEERRLKTIIWEGMNKEYLEEQAAKEAAAAAARAAYKANLVNTSGVVYSAEELEAKTDEALAKAEKEKKRRRTEKTKNMAPADTPTEATREMLKRKTFSSRVNYQVLNTLYTSDQDNNQQAEAETGDDGFDQQDTAQEDGNAAFDAGAVDNGYEAGKYEDIIDYDNFGDEDEGYVFGQDLEFEE